MSAVGIEKPVRRITVLHHKACRVMNNGECEVQIFYQILTQLDSFSCLPSNTRFFVHARYGYLKFYTGIEILSHPCYLTQAVT